MLIDKIVAYFDYNSGTNGECLYYYPDKVHCNNTITDADGNSTTCNNSLSVKPVVPSSIKPTIQNIINNLYSPTCNYCNQTPIINEPVLQSYLYPKIYILN